MKVINSYHCQTCNVSTEEFIESEIKEIGCSCGGVSRQVLHAGGSYFKINGTRMDINTEQWAKKREANARRHGRE